MSNGPRYAVCLLTATLTATLVLAPLGSDDHQPHLAEQLLIEMVLATSTATDVSSGPGMAIG